MKPIIIVPSGALTQSEIADIREGGYILLVSDEPEKIKILDKLDGKEKIFNALMRVVYNSSTNDTAYNLREWLCRILLQDMGAIKDK